MSENIYENHINSACLERVSSMFKTGSSLKCRNALDFDFTALTHLCLCPLHVHSSIIRHLLLALVYKK